MVAQGGQVIARRVHQLDDGSAFVHGAVSGALDMVAGIHQQHVHVRIFVALFEGFDVGIGQLRGLVVNIGMYVIGIQDGDGMLLRRNEQAVRSQRGAREAESRSCTRGSAGGFQEITTRYVIFHRNILLVRLFVVLVSSVPQAVENTRSTTAITIA